jgi:hypothetical protein
MTTNGHQETIFQFHERDKSLYNSLIYHVRVQGQICGGGLANILGKSLLDDDRDIDGKAFTPVRDSSSPWKKWIDGAFCNYRC